VSLRGIDRGASGWNNGKRPSVDQAPHGVLERGRVIHLTRSVPQHIEVHSESKSNGMLAFMHPLIVVKARDCILLE